MDAATSGLGNLPMKHNQSISSKSSRSCKASASAGSDVLASSGSVGRMSNRQAEPLLCRKSGLHAAHRNVRFFKDVNLNALTMRELRKYHVDTA